MDLKLKKSGMPVLIDEEDAHFCRAMQLGRDGIIYVRWWENKKQIRRALHRVIMGNPFGFQVDHINGNRFDNRKCNLRLATASQNTCNRSRPNKRLLHPYRGVAFFSRPGLIKRWHARLKVNGVAHSGGYHTTAEEAARAYDVLAKKHHGEFARLNFPNEGDQ
jgi:hypothetical protein